MSTESNPRRLRKRKQRNVFTPSRNYFEDEEKENKKSLSTDFESETLSSEFSEASIPSKSKQKRKKIRHTQDFQNVNDSLNRDVKVMKNTVGKTKKSKAVAYLPEIQYVTEEYVLQRNKTLNGERKSRKPVERSSNEVSCSDTPNQPLNGSSSHNEASESGNNKRSKRRTRRKTRKNRKVQSTEYNDSSENDVVFKRRDHLTISKDEKHGTEGASNDEEVLVASSTNSISPSNINKLNNDRNVLCKNTQNNVPVTENCDAQEPDSDSDSVEYNFKPKGTRNVNEHTITSPQIGLQGFEKAKESTSPFSSEKSNPNTKISFSSKSTNIKSKLCENSSPDRCNMKTDEVDNQENEGDDKISAQIAEKKILDTRNLESVSKTTTRKSVRFETVKSLKQNERTNCQVSDNFHSPDSTSKEMAPKVEQSLSPKKIENRRNTYELDQSVNDINVLKSLSVENTPDLNNSLSTCINNVPKENNKEELGGKQSHSEDRQKRKRKQTFNSEASVIDLTTPELGKNIPATDVENIEVPAKRRTYELDSPEFLENKKSTSGKGIGNSAFSKVTKRRKCKTTENDHSSSHIKAADNVFKNESITAADINKIANINNSIKNSSVINRNNTKAFTTSTPLFLRKSNNSLLKNTLENQISNKKVNRSDIPNKSSTKKLVSRTKMPDFSLIHKKALLRMESLDELLQRKAERAKILLSGNKPIIGSKKKSPKTTSPLESKVKKQLQFFADGHKANNSTADSPKPLNFIDTKKKSPPRTFPKSPQIKKKIQFSANKVNESTSTAGIQDSCQSRTDIAIKAEVRPSERKFPIKAIENKYSNVKLLNSKIKIQTPRDKGTLKLSLNDTPRSLKKSTLFQAKPEIDKREKPNVLAFRPQIDKAKHAIAPSLKSGYNRFGFKTAFAPSLAVNKQEQIKAVANKVNINKNKLEERRNIIKGVRSNRRFDLLMNMRKKT